MATLQDPANNLERRRTENDASQNNEEMEWLPNRQPPLSSSCWLHGPKPATQDINIIAGQQALRQIAQHGESDLSSELGGVLLGTAYRYEQQVYVDIKAALPAVSGDHGPVHFTFSADSWTQLHRDRTARYPGLEVVGWFHTHPDLGVFYSGDDVVVHSAAFTLPWQVGLVVDPVRKEGSFFGWVGGELSTISGFYERHEDGEESAVSWAIVPSSVWSNESRPELEGNSVFAPSNGWPGIPSFVAPLSALVAAAGLLLGFFLLVGWVIPLNRQQDRLESVVLMLADEKLSGDSYDSCPDSRMRILLPLNGDRVTVGDEVALVGSADYPGAYRYRAELKASGDADWLLISSRRRSTSFGQLAEWDTTDQPPRLYQIRLTAVDRNNVILANSPVCLVEIELSS